MGIPNSNPSYIDSVDEGAGQNVLSTASEVVAAANDDRQYFYCKNVGTVDISLGFGETAVDQKGVVLQADEGWEMPSNSIFTGAIHAVAASVTPALAFVEW